MAMNSKGTFKEIGIREGEKLHEVIITKDDSRSTYEYENHYIIYPNFDWWNVSERFTEGGVLIEEGFEYNPSNNVKWLKVEELKELLNKLTFE
ncbi:polysaccharide biosynthesis family protein [Clostridium argentinense CDC 2741]|uniref:Polysaccharide biosynthesis family protein n=1 Tax=Clostridium argentinense CDC 2741 TaxID=1418104 RepID=A0A0C1U2K6_9CLOT|nr:polysaccharide biosynthesis family protein [Clostridium argentinense CDC 2741]